MAALWNSVRPALLLLLAAQAPVNDATVAVRAGNHPDYGRLVFDTPPQTKYTVTRDGDRVLIRFAPDIVLSDPQFLPRNVTRLRTARTQVEFLIPPGAQIRRMRIGDRIVIDITDPPPVVPQPPPAEPAPVVPPATIPAPPPVAERDSGLVIPATDRVGAAMFRRGGVTYVVIDAAVSFAPPADPMFSDFSAHLLPDATVLRIVPKDGRGIALTRAPDGWRIEAVEHPAPFHPIEMTTDGNRIAFAVPEPGQTVSIPDPDNGAPLLIGTQRAPGYGIAGERRTVDFVLPATALGIMVEALSDRVTLRATPTGFVLSTPGADAR